MITRRTLLALPGAVAIAGLPACGGGGNDKNGNVRLVNATALGPIDLRIANANIISAIAQSAASAYVSVGEGTQAFQLGQNGVTTTLLTQSNAVAGSTNYTMVAYQTNSTLNAAYFADSEVAPTTGNGKFRMFNGALEAGALDVFVIAATADPSGSTPINANVAGQRVGSFSQIGAGSWRIVVTGTGDPTDVRLDIPAVTIADQQIATLVVTASGSGVLVNGLIVNQGGTVTANSNTQIRLRVVADLTGAGTVSVKAGTTTLAQLTSASIGSYKTAATDLSQLVVTAGTGPTTIDLSGQTVAAGSDVTLLIYGDPAAPLFKLLLDDNRIPSSTSKSKIRLLHGRNDLSAVSMSLTVNSTQVQDSVLFATAVAANAYTTVNAGADTSLQVYASGSANAIYDNSTSSTTLQTLVGQGVYTLFVLGGTGTTPIGRLVRDR